MNKETLGLIKPCAIKSGYEEDILNDIVEAGFEIVKQSKMKLTIDKAEEFYAEHRGKPFFSDLIDFMTSGDIIAFTISSNDNVVLDYRKLMGATNPKEAESGTLRYKYAKSLDMNAVHGSDSEVSAAREISIIFP